MLLQQVPGCYRNADINLRESPSWGRFYGLFHDYHNPHKHVRGFPNCAAPFTQQTKCLCFPMHPRQEKPWRVDEPAASRRRGSPQEPTSCSFKSHHPRAAPGCPHPVILKQRWKILRVLMALPKGRKILTSVKHTL